MRPPVRPRPRSLARVETLAVAAGICLPVPLLAATGLSVPLPNVVERIAAALVPWAEPVDVARTTPAAKATRPAARSLAPPGAEPSPPRTTATPAGDAPTPTPAAQPALTTAKAEDAAPPATSAARRLERRTGHTQIVH